MLWLLIFQAFVFQSFVSADTSVDTVLLTQIRRDSRFEAELDLGVVTFDQRNARITKRFSLKNSTESEFELTTVKASCSCTGIRLPMVKLLVGDVVECSVDVKIPSAMGKVVIGTVDVFNSASTQVGLIKVIATIDRPYSLEGIPGNVIIRDDAETTELRYPVVVSPKFSIDSLTVTLDKSVPIEVAIQNVDPRNQQIEIVIRGKRAELLKRKGISIRLNYTDSTWVLQEFLNLNFFDGLGWKVIPTKPQVQDGLAQFVLFRSAGIETNKLRCTSSAGEQLDAQYSVKARNCISVKLKVPKTVSEVLIVSGTDSFALTLEKEP